MKSVSSLIYVQHIRQRSSLLLVQTIIFFSSSGSDGGVFSCHPSLSFVLKHVGVIFNHNNLLTNTNIWGFYWILSSQMTKTFRDSCDINIVQQTSCEPPFPVVQMQLKTYFFVPFLRPCMHLNYGVISGSHACRDCGWHIQ